MDRDKILLEHLRTQLQVLTAIHKDISTIRVLVNLIARKQPNLTDIEMEVLSKLVEPST